MASFDETGSPGKVAFHEFRIVGSDVHAIMVVHFGSFFQAEDIDRLKDGWRYDVISGRRIESAVMRNVVVTQTSPDRPYCRVTVNMGFPRPGVLIWSSEEVASVDSFSVSYVGRSSIYPGMRMGDAWGEHWWILAGAFALLLLSLIIGGRQTVVMLPASPSRVAEKEDEDGSSDPPRPIHLSRESPSRRTKHTSFPINPRACWEPAS
jgi:hypothetical protein